MRTVRIEYVLEEAAPVEEVERAKPDSPAASARPLHHPLGAARVTDGFFMMFEPLPRDEHTIVVHGTNTVGADKTFIYHLTIE